MTALRISHDALAKLELTSAWIDSHLPKNAGYSAEKIYGPGGKLSRFWSMSWRDAGEMRAELMENMGGGVPIEVSDALVAICFEEVEDF